MPFDSTGKWIPEDDSAATQLNKLTSSNSDYMKVARKSGLGTANARGLINSSMAAGASQAAAIDRAAPIASQDAQAIAAKNLQHQQGTYDMDRQRLVTASADRNAALSAALEQQKAYMQAFTDLAQNKDIPAATRDAYIAHLMAGRGTGFDMIQQIYGINLDWGQPGGGNSTGTPSAGAYGVVPTKKDGTRDGGGGYSPTIPNAYPTIPTLPGGGGGGGGGGFVDGVMGRSEQRNRSFYDAVFGL